MNTKIKLGSRQQSVLHLLAQATYPSWLDAAGQKVCQSLAAKGLARVAEVKPDVGSAYEITDAGRAWLEDTPVTDTVTEPPAAGLDAWLAEGTALGAEGRQIRAERLAVAARMAAFLAKVPDSDEARAEAAEMEKQLASLLEDVTDTVTIPLSDQELDWDSMGLDELEQVTMQLVNEGLAMIRQRARQFSIDERFGLIEQLGPIVSPKLCACGCGEPVISDNPRAEYASGACRVRALRAARREQG